MGLSGKKAKQRIPNDPRNLSWADDAARFGSSYLSKFGWDASKGLGAEGEGRTTHIKVTQKLDMMGIGAAHQRDPNGIAWKQNRDFENVLRRLNDAELGKTVDTEEIKVGGFHRAQDDYSLEEPTEDVKKKKRKHKDGDKDVSGDQGKEKKKKRKFKDEKSDDNAQKADAASDITPTGNTAITAVEVDVVSVTEFKTAKPVSLPRHRSHRARAIAAKNMSSKSANHISEILGIAPSPSGSGSAAPQQGKLTSLVDDDILQLEKITTSTKSVADYFKEKLKARANSSPVAKDSDSDGGTLRRGIGSAPSTSVDPYEEDENPRFGLGASRLRFEASTDIDDAQRIGLSQFSKLTSSTFLAATATMIAPSPQATSPVESSIDNEAALAERLRKGKKKKNRPEAADSDEENEEIGKKQSKKARKGKASAHDHEDEHQPDTLAVDLDDESRTQKEKGRKKKKKKDLEKEDVNVPPLNKKKRRKDEER